VVVYFEIEGEVEAVEIFATGSGIRQIEALREEYGGRRWNKVKGIAKVRLSNGTIRAAELHWYEAHGIGRKRMKIKRFLD
jgi:hypothetical protein